MEDKIRVDGIGLIAFLIGMCMIFSIFNARNTKVIKDKVIKIESVIVKSDSTKNEK